MTTACIQRSALIRQLLAASCLLVLTLNAHARGVSPYLPLNLSPEIERDIERVLLLGDQTVLTRPIPAARVLEALPAACKRDSRLCTRVKTFLNRYMHGSGLAHASVEGAYSNDTAHALPNRHGMASDSAWRISTSGYAQLGDYFLVSGGVAAYDGDSTPTGSMLSIGIDYAQLDIGYRDHWYSPMTDSTMLIGTNAATLPSVTLSNYAPISSLGLRYEVFLARMEYSNNIGYQSGYTSGNPRLAGIHLSIEPAEGWALGANRVIQFGGGERGGRGAKDFFNALFKPHDYDNTSSALSSDQEFGNQIAAWTSRMVFPGRTPFAVYFEYAGEDSSFSGNYRLGNSALSMGIDIPQLWNSFNVTYEVSEWQNSWYVHSIYGDGLTNDGRGIGHWFADNRSSRDAVGGQSHMLRLGWEPGFGGVAELRYRTLANETYSGVDYSRAHDVALRYSYPFRQFLVGGEINVGRDVFGEDYSRVAAFARFGGEYGMRGSVDTDESESDSNLVDYFVDAGASASRVKMWLADGNPEFVTDAAYAPHLAIGARRAVSAHSDLGARIELDRIEGATLVALRALDYRYRLGDHFALTGFLGAARYDVATPALGYYLGLGAQWRNLARNLDLSLDVRFGDKIARDKFATIPSDPPSTPTTRPDQFYDLYGATLYLSYRL